MWYWFIIFPLTGALLGWIVNHLMIGSLFYPLQKKQFFGFRWQGLIPANREKLGDAIAGYASKEIPFDVLEKKIGDPANFEKLRPVIEKHVDDFLNVKLAKEMPVVSMFIGSKTISSLKKTFMQELESLFPEVMAGYAGNLKNEINIHRMVHDKISTINLRSLAETFYRNNNRQLNLVRVAGAVTGMIAGLINAAIAFLLL